MAARTLGDAEDLAAVLHERVDQRMPLPTASRRDHDRIAGLFSKVPAVNDPDMARALNDRETLIEHQARDVAERAVRGRHPWAAQLGTPPTDPVRGEQWTRCLETVAAYRERWGVTERRVLGSSEPTSLEQESQRRLAQRAVDEALLIHRRGQESVGAGVHIGERNAGRGGVE